MKEELNILDKEKEKKVAETKVSDGKFYINAKIICFAFIFLLRNMDIFTLIRAIVRFPDCNIHEMSNYFTIFYNILFSKLNIIMKIVWDINKHNFVLGTLVLDLKISFIKCIPYSLFKYS